MAIDTLEGIYNHCAPLAFRRALALLNSEVDAWDAVHEVFCTIVEKGLLPKLCERPMAYLYRAVTNQCLNELVARRRRTRREETHGEAAPSTDERMLARNLLEKLADKLDDTDRAILVFWYLDGLPQEDIADLLGVWRRTVGRRLARLRQLVEEIEGAPRRSGT